MCCGKSNSSNKTIRTQKIQKQRVVKPSKQASAREISRAKAATSNTIKTSSIPAQRQRMTRTDRCSECNHPVVMVNIAGREREQCSNPGCRKIKR